MTDVIHLPAGEGQSVWYGGAVLTFKAGLRTTNGVLTFAEAAEPPGSGPPPHIHEAADEAFFMLSGELEFLNEDKTFIARDGDFVFIPRGVRHRYTNVGSDLARVLFLYTPGGMEDFFAEIGTEPRPGQTPPPMTPEQLRLIGEVAPRYGLHITP